MLVDGALGYTHSTLFGSTKLPNCLGRKERHDKPAENNQLRTRSCASVPRPRADSKMYITTAMVAVELWLLHLFPFATVLHHAC
jgi:hypothetical protein